MKTFIALIILCLTACGEQSLQPGAPTPTPITVKTKETVELGPIAGVTLTIMRSSDNLGAVRAKNLNSVRARALMKRDDIDDQFIVIDKLAMDDGEEVVGNIDLSPGITYRIEIRLWKPFRNPITCPSMEDDCFQDPATVKHFAVQ